jgi:nitroreductase
MDLHEALYTTRAMRRLKPDPIPYDVQARILDAAIRAPNTDEQWRFILVDDPAIKAQLAPLYRRAAAQLQADFGVDFSAMAGDDSPIGRAVRSAQYLERHFAEVPLLLCGFSRTGGSGILPALWNAMLAARAEGVGSTMTTILAAYCKDEVNEILGVPKDEGWSLQAVIPMGYPRGRWGLARRNKPVHEVAARNRWAGDLGFEIPEPLWSEQGR